MSDILSLRNEILNYVSKNGPVLPVQISKQINNNIIFAGAILSELVTNKKIKLSSAKIGSSPVYYTNGQEHKLSMLYPYLKEVYKKVYDLLKEKKVLQDIAIEPWQRVALREIPDFAVMLRTKDNQIFWRWYLISDNQAIPIIKDMLGMEEEKIEPKVEIPESESIKEIPEQEIKEELKIELKPEPIKETIEEKPKQKKLIKVKKKIEDINMNEFFSSKSIEIIDEKIIKKNKEFNYTGEISSDLGLMKIFIKYINKKRISDADLISAHNEAQLKKLALYFISPGDLTKKAKDYTKNNFLIFEKLK
jgi:hypothetical protein